MKYKKNHEVVSQLKILGESYTTRIEFNFNCDDELEIYSAELDTGLNGYLEIVDSWMQTQAVMEKLEDIVFNEENENERNN